MTVAIGACMNAVAACSQNGSPARYFLLIFDRPMHASKRIPRRDLHDCAAGGVCTILHEGPRAVRGLWHLLRCSPAPRRRSTTRR
jgi:hypothetical protein